MASLAEGHHLRNPATPHRSDSTQPSRYAASVQVNQVAQRQSPDLPDVLIHMTGRVGRRAKVRDDVRTLKPLDRLASILAGGALIPAPPFGSDWPVVCFTQTTRRALAALTTSGRYDGVGIAFTTEFVFQGGGAPVMYIRGDEYRSVAQNDTLSQAFKSRFVRYWPGATNAGPLAEILQPELVRRSEWLHEREWRVPHPEGHDEPWAWHYPPEAVAFLTLRSPDQQHQLLARITTWQPTKATWTNQIPVMYLDSRRETFAGVDERWP